MHACTPDPAPLAATNPTRAARSAPTRWRAWKRVCTPARRRHSGEIRISVEAGLPLSYLWRDLTARDRAVTLFGKLRVWDTEHNNGVLIYLLLAEHAIEIVADRGLARHVAAAQWQALVAGMREAFRAGRFEEGLLQAVDGGRRAAAAALPAGRGPGQPERTARPRGPALRKAKAQVQACFTR